MPLFHWGQFKSAAGLDLGWKIECDALTDADWMCIAKLALPMVGSFHRVAGVPRGGLVLAECIASHQHAEGRQWLLVDDVWTTGISMQRHADQMGWREGEWKGFVVFARGTPLPPWVQCLCKINTV